MCIICVSGKGVRQPSENEIRTMFRNNPHGAGYMVAEPDGVRIEKGFMTVFELLRELRRERFTKDDVVVYHFRISTQAGVNPEMTQPFPLVDELSYMKELSLIGAGCGVAHNGIIKMTSDPTETEYSDTALFTTFYLTDIVKQLSDLKNQKVLDKISEMIQSKMVLLDKSGYFAVIGEFHKKDGLLFSNYSWEDYRKQFTLDDVKRWRKIIDADEKIQSLM